MAREVKYQLSSTLRGLGTANLAQLCGGYQVGVGWELGLVEGWGQADWGGGEGGLSM